MAQNTRERPGGRALAPRNRPVRNHAVQFTSASGTCGSTVGPRFEMVGPLTRWKSHGEVPSAMGSLSWFGHLLSLDGVREKVWIPNSLDKGMLMTKEVMKYQYTTERKLAAPPSVTLAPGIRIGE